MPQFQVFYAAAIGILLLLMLIWTLKIRSLGKSTVMKWVSLALLAFLLVLFIFDARPWMRILTGTLFGFGILIDIMLKSLNKEVENS